MNKYNNSKIYKLINKQNNEIIYVGSTINKLNKRMCAHRVDSIKFPERKIYIECNRIGMNNVRIVLVENVVCQNKENLHMREQYYIDLLVPGMNARGAVFNVEKEKENKKKYYTENKVELGKKNKKYHTENKAEIDKYQKDYHIENKAEINKYQKDYYIENKNEINKICTCSCGSTFTKHHFSSHIKSNKHKNYESEYQIYLF